MNNLEFDTSAIMRQTIQIVSDLANKPFPELRIIDLGCAHGHYTFELAKLGAELLGIEGRATWLAQANQTKQENQFTRVEFVQDDVRNLSKEKYGEFDTVLCLGLLYHLDVPALFNVVQAIFDICTDFALIETHFAGKPTQMHTWNGKQYWGVSIQEHEADATDEEKRKRVGASLDNNYSFWLTKPSLFNLLQHVGFTSVYECRTPLAHLRVGAMREFKMWGNRTMLVALKRGSPQLHGDLSADLHEDWPENFENYFFEQYLYEQQFPLRGKIQRTVRRLIRRFLPHRIL